MTTVLYYKNLTSFHSQTIAFMHLKICSNLLSMHRKLIPSSNTSNRRSTSTSSITSTSGITITSGITSTSGISGVPVVLLVLVVLVVLIE